MVLEVELPKVLLGIIHKTHAGLDKEDSSILELVEIRPRSGNFAKTPLSCSISPNDPSDPDAWHDEEIASPGQKYNLYPGGKFVETGNGQYMNLRFTVDFTMFFLDLGISGDEAYVIARTIMSRLHSAILREGERRGGAFSYLFRSDEFGAKLINANRAVKRRHIRSGGSKRKTLYKGKMWLQFEAYIEAQEE